MARTAPTRSTPTPASSCGTPHRASTHHRSSRTRGAPTSSGARSSTRSPSARRSRSPRRPPRRRPSPSAGRLRITVCGARMPAPVLLAVVVDSAALGDVEREQRDRYASGYQVICTGSPDEALAILTRLSDAEEEVALVLAGLRLSETTGGELLERVGRLHPHAKRGLLVAWGDA